MKHSVAVFFWVLALPSFAGADEGRSRLSVDRLADYLFESTGGGVYADSERLSRCRHSDSGCEDYVLIPGKHPRVKSKGKEYLAASLFKLDPVKFARAFDAEDVLEAKRRISLEGPRYASLDAWQGLPHPKVGSVAGDVGLYDSRLRGPVAETGKEEFFDKEFQYKLDLLTESELSAGNKVSLVNPDERVQRILDLVSRSERFLFIAVPEFGCKGAWAPVLQEIIRKREAGVEVRLLVEASGFFRKGLSCLSRAASSGVHVNKVRKGRNVLSLFAKMRLNFWLRDGVESIVSNSPALWVQEGPLNTDMLEAFVLTWRGSDGNSGSPSIQPYLKVLDSQRDAEFRKEQRGQIRYERWLGNPETRMSGLCRFPVQPVGAARKALADVFGELMLASKHQVIWATTRYEKARKLPSFLSKMVNENKTLLEVVTNARYRKTFEGLRALGLGTQDRIQAWGTLDWQDHRGGIVDRLVTVATTAAWDKGGTKRNQEQAVICMDRGLSAEFEEFFTLLRANANPMR